MGCRKVKGLYSLALIIPKLNFITLVKTTAYGITKREYLGK